MEILILCDMEGVAGIQSWEHTGGSSPLYDEGRRLYTGEVCAAVRGCLTGGASRIIAQDGHGGSYPGAKTFMNWIPDRLEPGAEYVRGYRWGRYVEPMDARTCDAVVLLGVHAMAGAENAVLCHTVNADGWQGVSVNGDPMGECGILAALAGEQGVPVVAVAGDAAACAEVSALVGAAVVQIPVKWGYGRYAARTLAPADAHTRIEQGMMQALNSRDNWPSPFRVSAPVEIAVDFASPDRATPYVERSGVVLDGPRRVVSRGSTFTEAWFALWGLS